MYSNKRASRVNAHTGGRSRAQSPATFASIAEPSVSSSIAANLGLDSFSDCITMDLVLRLTIAMILVLCIKSAYPRAFYLCALAVYIICWPCAGEQLA